MSEKMTINEINAKIARVGAELQDVHAGGVAQLDRINTQIEELLTQRTNLQAAQNRGPCPTDEQLAAMDYVLSSAYDD